MKSVNINSDFYIDRADPEAIEWIDYNVLGVMGGKGFTILYSNEFI